MSQAQKPTARQNRYLRDLAHRTGQTFAVPETRKQASAEISRLRTLTTHNQVDIARERDAVTRDLCERPDDATRVHPSEIAGYGATATWA